MGSAFSCILLREVTHAPRRTGTYQAVHADGLAEAFLTSGEIFLQQVHLGQRQVIGTGGASLKAEQLVGKCPVNKLWRKGTAAQLGELANCRHPQKHGAGGLTCTSLISMNRKQTEHFFPSFDSGSDLI